MIISKIIRRADVATNGQGEYYKYKSQGLVVIGIALYDSETVAKAAAKSLGKTFPLGLDVDSTIGVDYGVTGVPESFLIDSNGIVRQKVTGPVNESDILTFIRGTT